MSQTTQTDTNAPVNVGARASASSSGGLARAAALSGEQRSRISRKAALARHDKARDKARHRTVSIPRVDPSLVRPGGLEPPFHLPVATVERFGVHKDLLRWFMIPDDASGAEFRPGDVLIVAGQSCAKPGEVVVVSDGETLAIGRVRAMDGAVTLDAIGHGRPAGPATVVGRVVGRMGGYHAVQG